VGHNLSALTGLSKRSAPMHRGGSHLQTLTFSFGWPKHTMGKRSERGQAA
jgi:hypothetical protein